HQFGKRLNLVVFRSVIIPTRTDRGIDFSGNPVGPVFMSRAKLLIMGPAGPYFIAPQQAPVGLIGKTRFGPHPAHVGTSVTKDNRFRLQLSHQIKGFFPFVVAFAIYTPRFVGPSVITISPGGTVKPDLNNVSVVCEQFTQLISEVG